MTDWTLIQTQYEILGKTVEELSKAHHVKPDILALAAESQGWQQTPVVVDDEVNEALNNKSTAMQIHHQAQMLPKYIEIEATFMARLHKLAWSFEDAKEAKLLAETLTLLKPAVMRHAEAPETGGGSGGMKIAIVNQFPTPQPGEDNYIAPNAVILGEHARKNNGISDTQDFAVIEIDLPTKSELN